MGAGMNRRELLSRIPLFLMAIPVASSALGGCASEEPYPPRPPGGGGGGGGGDTEADPDAGAETSFLVQNQDSSGHPHSFEMSCASLDGRQYTYTAGGAHTHMVTLTDEDIDDILSGRTVTIETTGGHPHTWVIAMPASLCP